MGHNPSPVDKSPDVALKETELRYCHAPSVRPNEDRTDSMEFFRFQQA